MKSTENQNVEAKEQKQDSVKLGLPYREFEATVDTLAALRGEGRDQLFLARQSSLRVIGNVDELRLTLGKKLGGETPERARAERLLEEVQTFVQVFLSCGNPEQALDVFERQIFREKFREVDKDSDTVEALRDLLKKKIQCASRLVLPSLLERAKRLSTALGPLLEDVDIELISQRACRPAGAEITSPFLRLRFRYSVGGETQFPLFLLPWVTDAPRNTKSFEIECDESDIDLMVRRLLEAKEILARSLKEKVEQTHKVGDSNG